MLDLCTLVRSIRRHRFATIGLIAGYAIMSPSVAVAEEGLSSLGAKQGALSTQEAIKALEEIAAIQEANFRAIQSFEGIYSLQDKYKYTVEPELVAEIGEDTLGPGPWRRIDQGEVTVRFDSSSGASFNDVQILKTRINRDATGGRRAVALPYESHQMNIVNRVEFFSFRPEMRYGDFLDFPQQQQMRGRAVIRDSPDKGREYRTSNVFYFEDFFSYGQPFWEVLQGFRDALVHLAKERSEAELKEWFSSVKFSGDEPSGETVSFRQRFTAEAGAPVSSGITVQIKCSSGHGWNIREATLFGPDGTEQQIYTWEYTKRGGIFVPERVWRASLSADGEKIDLERLLVLESSVVNGVVGPKWFSWRAFGLEEGERVVDRIEQKMFVVQDGELVEAKSVKAVVPGSPTSIRFIFLWVANGIAVVVVLYLLYRSRRLRDA